MVADWSVRSSSVTSSVRSERTVSFFPSSPPVSFSRTIQPAEPSVRVDTVEKSPLSRYSPPTVRHLLKWGMSVTWPVPWWVRVMVIWGSDTYSMPLSVTAMVPKPSAPDLYTPSSMDRPMGTPVAVEK